MKKRLLALLLVLAMVVMLAACGGKDNGGSSEPEKQEEEQQEEEGEEPARDDLVFQIAAEPGNLELTTNGTMDVAYIDGQIYGGLVTFAEGGEIVGELAESWTWNDDYSSITFTLRDGIKFSDGKDITPQDFIYTYNLESNKTGTYLNHIASMEAPDDKTLVLNLDQPYSSQLNLLCNFHAGVIPEGAAEQCDLNEGCTAYSGPYMLEAWNKGENIVLAANPYWYDADNVAIKKATFVFIGDENNARTALESGEIDIMNGTAGLSAAAMETVSGIDGISTKAMELMAVVILCPNFNVPELADQNVRHAIDLAIDRAALLKVTTPGVVLGNWLADEGFGGDYVEGHEAHAQDVEAAKEYMAKSAYPDGFTVEMKTPTKYMKACTIVQEELAEIGITVDINEVDASVWLNDYFAGNYQLGIVSVSNTVNDMSGFLALYTPGANLHFNFAPDDTTYNLMNDALTKGGDARHEAMVKTAEYEEEYLQWIGIFNAQRVLAFNSGLEIGPLTPATIHIDKMHW